MTSDPIRQPAAPAARSILRRAGRVSGLVFLAVAAVLAGSYGALCVTGLPPAAIRRLERLGEGQGLRLEVYAARPARPGTLRLEGFRLRTESGVHALEADRLEARYERGGGWRFRVWGAKVAPVTPGGGLSPGVPLADRISGAFRIRDGIAEIEADGRVGNRMDARLRGVVIRDAGPDPVPRRTWGELWNDASERLASAREAWWVPVLGGLRVPEAEILFRVHLGPSGPGRVSLRASGGRAVLFGLAAESWQVAVNGKDGRADPVTVRIRSARRTMEMDGWVDGNRRRLSVSCRADISGFQLLRLAEAWLPDSARIPAGAATRGSVTIEAETGDVSWDAPFDRLSGRIGMTGPAVLWGVPIDRLDARFRWDGERLILDPVEGVFGGSPSAGVLSGRLEAHPGTREFRGAAEGQFDPAVLASLMTEEEAFHAASLRFPGVLPRGRAEFSGVLGEIGALRLEGRVDAQGFLYNGAYLEEAGFDLVVERETARFCRLRVRRPEGELTGEILQDFAAGRADFDITSTMHPHAVGSLLGPASHRFIRQFHFSGPARVAGSGWVAYRDPIRGRFDLAFAAEEAGILWATAERIEGTIELRDARLSLSGLRGRAFGGDFEADLAFDLPAGPWAAPRYEASGHLRNADFGRFLGAVTRSDRSRLGGRLTADMTLAGSMGEGQGPTARGGGRLRIRDGNLLSVPLLGGLSQILSNLWPGLGYLSQTDLEAAFEVGESRVRTEDLSVKGTILSLSARGEAGFDQSLQFLVQAQLLRRGPVAEALRIITFPLTKLLEFDLSGDASRPEWRPRNLP